MKINEVLREENIGKVYKDIDTDDVYIIEPPGELVRAVKFEGFNITELYSLKDILDMEFEEIYE